jgi:hypothetical protein
MPKINPNVRIIKGKEFLEDVRFGMTDFELSEKYGLTFQDLDRVLGYLLDAGLIDKGELQDRQQLSDSQILRAFVESCEEMKIVD